MSIQKLITLNILFSPGKPNNTHSSRWSKLPVLPDPLSPEMMTHWSRFLSLIDRYASSVIAYLKSTLVTLSILCTVNIIYSSIVKTCHLF